MAIATQNSIGIGVAGGTPAIANRNTANAIERREDDAQRPRVDDERVTLSQGTRVPESSRTSGITPIDAPARAETAQEAPRPGAGLGEVENGRDQAARSFAVQNFRGFGEGTLTERTGDQGRTAFEFNSNPREDGSQLSIRGEGDAFSPETTLEVQVRRPSTAVAQYRQFE